MSLFSQFSERKVSSKSISNELRSKDSITNCPGKIHRAFENDNLEWNEIYSLPFKVALDTRTREFQYRLLNRYQATNSFFQKIGKIDSSICSFCNAEAESLEHLFLSCPIIYPLWANLIVWCNSKNMIYKPSHFRMLIQCLAYGQGRRIH